jgi:hypothetical protein
MRAKAEAPESRADIPCSRLSPHPGVASPLTTTWRRLLKSGAFLRPSAICTEPRGSAARGGFDKVQSGHLSIADFELRPSRSRWARDIPSGAFTCQRLWNAFLRPAYELDFPVPSSLERLSKRRADLRAASRGAALSAEVILLLGSRTFSSRAMA